MIEDELMHKFIDDLSNDIYDSKQIKEISSILKTINKLLDDKRWYN